MTAFLFIIPSNRTELLREAQSNYTVKNVVIPADIVPRLEDAYVSLREEGPNFILDHFDTYYSVLHHGHNLRPDVINKAYNHLCKATQELNNSLLFLLEDPKSLNDDVKSRTVSTLKMLIYIYIEFVIYFEKKKKTQEDNNLVGKSRKQEKKDDTNITVNKSKVLNTLNSILQREICVFWQPPVVEHDFINLISELCFALLQNPTIKQEKEVITNMFGVFGNLVKSYDYGKTFVSRLIQTIRMYDHVVNCVSDAIKFMVQQFNCQSLIHYLVKEATEWQADETFQDVQGTRCCSLLLTELAIAMPDLILPEVAYLDQYLAHESVPLRNAVLNVLTEIILNVLTRHDLTDEEKESRDELFDTIIEHFYDVSALVRAKVIQNLTKLQKESAIPLSYQDEILTENIKHLHDKGVLVRKCAITAVTVSLEYNPFGAALQLKKAQDQLAEKKQLLNEMEMSYREAHQSKIEHLEAEWSNIEQELTAVVKQALDEEKDDDESDDEQENEQPQEIDVAVETIRKHLKEKNFLQAFKLCRKVKNSINECKDMAKNRDGQEVNVYLAILHTVFINRVKIVEELRTLAGMTPEDISKLEALEKVIKYFENTVSFLKIMNSAIEPMKSLLFSQSISDMQEALNFFVAAYQFQIDRASEGILEMLKMMRCSEQERKKLIVGAFKTMYLTTDTNNMTAHTTTIVNRIIALLKDLAYDNLEDFQNIVVEWITQGILDNNIIDRLWQYYTQREPVSNEDARAAADILRMAAMARNTIITKNIAVVSKVMFMDQHKDDWLFLGSSCRLLATAGSEKIDMQSENAPFRIKYSDEIFQKLTDVIVDGFFRKNSYYSDAMQSAVDFIYRVCSKPLDIIEDMLKRIHEKMKEYPKYMFLIVRLCELLGRLAMNTLDYLDNSVYREMKRRNYLREERKKEKKNNKNKEKQSKRKSKTVLNASVLSETGSVNDSIVLAGAEAEDADAEFVMSVLENDVVSRKSVLGEYSSIIVTICQRPDLYPYLLVQLSAVTALIRYMLVSGNFCREHIRLLFTILERTNYPEIKSTILIHCADLLPRFPNIVEPWSPRIYDSLRDHLPEVRKKAFFSLANLILRDMIRPQAHFADMAACLIDPDPEVSGMCRSFFERLSQKEHGLVNAIPDIFTKLVRMDQIDQESLRFIMKFLFDLVDTNSKRMENLVDRFCHKYTPDDNTRLNKNITYCLSLIGYNDKALRKLREMFPTYQHHLHDAEIYSTFKQILTECSKTKPGKVDLKPIVTEIEACIASVFVIGEDGQPAKPPPVTLKSAKKGGKGRSKKKSAKKQSDSEDSDDDDVRNRNRKRKKSNRRQRNSSSSD